MSRRLAKLAAAALLVASSVLHADDPSNITWKKIPLTDKFYAEGANAGDFNKDGKMDVVYGPYWWAGPDFKQRHQIFKPTGKEAEGSWKPDNDYSRDAFFAFTYDFDNDGYTDYLTYAFPGEAAKLYINPKGRTDQPWKMHKVFDVVDNESPMFGDFDGDGKPEGVFNTNSPKVVPPEKPGPDGKRKVYGVLGIAKPDWSDPTKPWTFQAVSPKREYFQRFTHDFDNDGYTDYLTYAFPGEAAKLYINPKGQTDKPWKMHKVFDVVDNESPMFGDFDGDGKPEGVFNTNSPKVVPPEKPGPDGKRKVYGVLGIAKPDWSDPTKPWTFQPVSPKREYFQRFTHGFGYGDVNGDGKNDMMEARSWWENTGSGEFKEHPHPFGQGGAQMYAYDVDGDGLNDVVTSLQAHGVGLAWFQQTKKDDGSITFKRHLILPDKYEPNKQGIKFSQLHAVDLVDINGDGLKDIVTGKRHFAHGSKGDIDPTAPAVVYWFELKRNPDKTVEWIGHKADEDAGVGVQVVARDVSGDGKPDILIGNKKGACILIQQ